MKRFLLSLGLVAVVLGVLAVLPSTGIDQKFSALKDLRLFYSPFDLSNRIVQPVVARIFNRIIDLNNNACGLDIDDVITLDGRYTVHWICGGDQAPCTIYSNNKVFSQVVGGGSLQLKTFDPATVYTIKNRDNQSCGFKIAHKFQAPGSVERTTTASGGGSGSSVASSTLNAITYADEDDFEQVVIDHTALYDNLTIATTTILANDAAATATIRTAVADIISFTSDESLSSAEEETISDDSDALAAIGTGLEIVKVTIASSSESFLWMREDDGVKDTGVNMIFRIADYKAITGGDSSQYLLLGSPHWDDDSYTLNFPLRELVRHHTARALIIGTTDKYVLNPTGTGADSNTSDDTSPLSGGNAFCTGVTNSPGFLLANDIGTYYTRNIAGGTDAMYLIPYGGDCDPPTHIFSDTTSPGLFDNPRGFTLVGTSRRMMVADRSGEEFWCFDLESDGTYSSSTAVVRSNLTDATFEADSIAASPDGTVLYVVDDPDLNVNATDNRLIRFAVDSGCNIPDSFDVIASDRGEIDNMFFDAYGNLIFTEDQYTDEGETDIYYINNAQGGGTTISQLVDGDSRVLAESIAGHKLDDITVNAITLTSSDRGLGSGNIILTDDTGDELYTFVISRASDGTITGLERTKLTDFSATTYTVEGLAMDDSNQKLIIFQENDSDVGTFYELSNYNEMIVDTNNFTDVSRIIGYQTIVEEFVETLNTIHWQWHGYRITDWSITTCGVNDVNPWTVSDGVNSSTKPTIFTYLEDLVSDYMTGYDGCTSDFVEIFPGAQVPLGAQTNKQGEFIQTLNPTIGVDSNDIFMQSELPFDVRNESLRTHGTDGSNRWHDAHKAF